MSVLGGILRILEEQKDTAALTARRTEFETVFRAFGNAIIQNSHFIALSPNVEEFEQISLRMQALYPDGAAFYKDLTDYRYTVTRTGTALSAKHGHDKVEVTVAADGANAVVQLVYTPA